VLEVADDQTGAAHPHHDTSPNDFSASREEKTLVECCEMAIVVHVFTGPCVLGGLAKAAGGEDSDGVSDRDVYFFCFPLQRTGIFPSGK
jgi:hypothetical protein